MGGKGNPHNSNVDKKMDALKKEKAYETCALRKRACCHVYTSCEYNQCEQKKNIIAARTSAQTIMDKKTTTAHSNDSNIRKGILYRFRVSSALFTGMVPYWGLSKGRSLSLTSSSWIGVDISGVSSSLPGSVGIMKRLDDSIRSTKRRVIGLVL